MVESRPVELSSYIEATSEKNDKLIVEAFLTLEDPAARGKLRLTVASLCHLSGLSRNTVRSREWALERLKGLKLKSKSALSDKGPSSQGEADDGAILNKHRRMIKQLREQNALLYEEVLCLRRAILEKDKVIETLKARKSASVTALPRLVEIQTSDS